MNLRLEAGLIKDRIELPASKSHANRFLILAARRGRGSTIHRLPKSDDVFFLRQALQRVGLKITGEESLVFHNSFPDCEESAASPIQIDVGEGGTTARFLLALLSSGKRPYVLRTQGRLALRPWDELIETLRAAGASVSWQGSDLHVQGPVKVKDLPRTISAARSTQFASALQLAFAIDGYDISPTAMESSRPYWEMTQKSILQMADDEVTVPLDWSSAAYPLVFAAIMDQELVLPGLVPDQQADCALFHWLLARGAAAVKGNAVRCHGLRDRSPLDFIALDCPDLVPALAFLAAHLTGEHHIRGVKALRHKESDRLSAILSLLDQCGVKAHYDSPTDVLHIWGGVIAGAKMLHVPADHRLVMTGALFLRASGGGTIGHASAVNKSFPDFFKLFEG